MSVKWDYTRLAPHYAKRPDYAGAAIDELCSLAGASAGTTVCDIGAGTGHLTRLLLDRGLNVVAVEPNDAMRGIGQQVTAGRNVHWLIGTGENTGQPDHAFTLVTFGSSFNTTDRQLTLRETARILKPGGWFACMWNHRDLDDPLQHEVEEYLLSRIPGYSYGSRREDQRPVIDLSGLFRPVHYIEAGFVADIAAEDYMEAWRSHGTLEKQAGAAFADLISGIEQIVKRQPASMLRVPYVTRLWAARLR